MFETEFIPSFIEIATKLIGLAKDKKKIKYRKDICNALSKYYKSLDNLYDASVIYRELISDDNLRDQIRTLGLYRGRWAEERTEYFESSGKLPEHFYFYGTPKISKITNIAEEIGEIKMSKNFRKLCIKYKN